jgi:hypothetical protein
MARSDRIDPLLAQTAWSTRRSLSLLDQLDELMMQHITLLEQRIRILSEVMETIQTVQRGGEAGSVSSKQFSMRGLSEADR